MVNMDKFERLHGAYSMIWTREIDGDAEYNEHFTIEDGKQFKIYSDVDEETWTLEYPDGTTEDLDADDIDEAQDEAFDCVKDWLDDNG
jgi:hypothetical protein